METESSLEKKGCVYEGLTYSHGTGLCVASKCVICEDGDWEEDAAIWQPPSAS
jgi:hypothetical protein